MEELFLENKGLIVSLFGFLVIAISSNRIAHVFQKIHLPLITGMIFTGILVGPYLLGLIPKTAKTDLHFINEMALAFIAFAAGAELYVRELRSRFRSIKWNTFVFSDGCRQKHYKAKGLEKDSPHPKIFLNSTDLGELHGFINH